MKWDTSSFKGLSFGAVSGAITTLGMMVGLDIGTQNKLTVILGVLTIAIADALSDALGVHVSEESQEHSETKVWKSTLSTFAFKFLFATSFLIPLLLLELDTAIIVSVVYGLVIIGVMSYFIAKRQKEDAHNVIIEHLFIAVLVIITTFFVGKFFSTMALN